MSDTVELGSVATIVAGQSPPGSTYNEEGRGLPFFQGKAEFGEVYPTAVKWCVAPTKLAEAGDILISVRAPVGPTNIAAERCCIGRGLAAVRPDDTKADRGFVHWALVAARPTLESKGNGSTFSAINRSDLASLRIRLPPVEEQRQIVGLLDRAAEIRRRADAARAKARAIIPALFLDTFGDPATNSKGWQVETVGDVLDSASYGTSEKASAEGPGSPVVRMGNVMADGRLDTSDLKFVELSDSERGKTELLEGDLLFNRTNSKDLVGKTGLWDGRFQAVAASYFIRLRVKRAAATPTYVWAFFNTAHMKRVLFDTARGAIGQANINTKELRAFRIAIPPLPLQADFADEALRIEAVAAALDSSAGRAEALAAALSAEVFGA